MKENTICFTGHRPEKLTVDQTYIKTSLLYEIENAVAEGVTTFISGMARGVDLWAAEFVLEFRRCTPIQLLCAVPYEGFETK